MAFAVAGRGDEGLTKRYLLNVLAGLKGGDEFCPPISKMENSINVRDVYLIEQSSGVTKIRKDTKRREKARKDK